MIFRTILMTALLFTLVACAGTEGETGGEIHVDARDEMTAMPLDGEGVTRDGVDYEGDVVPGSQDDLTVNVGDRVFFGYDRYDLTPDAQRTLEMQAEWLKRYPGVSITVEGHTDERGTREYNLALGERRANSVRNYLVALGVDADRINIISYGKERPAVVGTGASVWSQNRRAVTVVE